MTTTSCDCDKCHIVWTIEWTPHEHGDFAIPEPQTITLCEHRRRRIRGSVGAISFTPYPGFACNECIRLKHAERLAAGRLGRFAKQNRGKAPWEYQEQRNTLEFMAREAAAKFLGHKMTAHAGSDYSGPRK